MNQKNTAVLTFPQRFDNLVSLQLQAEAPRYAEYVSYLAHEEGQNDPARIQVLYERAIQENCLIPELWSKYTKYIVSRLLNFVHIGIPNKGYLSYENSLVEL